MSVSACSESSLFTEFYSRTGFCSVFDRSRASKHAFSIEQSVQCYTKHALTNSDGLQPFSTCTNLTNIK